MEKIKNLAKSILYYSRYYHLIRFWDELTHPEGKLLILTYHNISDGRENLAQVHHPFKLRPVTTCQQFELHLRILKKSYQVVSLEEGVQWLKRGKELKDKLVAITFDDGYESFYTLALPVLKKYDFPATMFLPTDYVNQDAIFWWDKLNRILFHFESETPPSSQLIPIMGEKLAKQFCAAGNDLRRKIEFLVCWESHLRNIEGRQRDEKIESLKEILLPGQDIKMANPGTLTWDQIAKMTTQGIAFGSHTCCHLNLKFARLEQVREELAKSKEIIEKKIRVRVNCFAYPYDADFETHLRVKSVLRDLEYECACTCTPGVNLSDHDPFFLRRTTLPMTTSNPLIARELLLDCSGKFQKKHARGWIKPGASQTQLNHAEIERCFAVDRQSN
jgi:peptidoglycan/xylan/chitin deacetylase (PgdA/CDA1 family)